MSYVFSGTYDSNNSSNGLVITDTKDLFFGTGDFTVEFFIKTSSPAQRRVIAVGCYPTEYFSITIENGLQVWLGGSSGSFLRYTTYAANYWTDWHHVAVTRQSGTVRMYRDGVKLGEGSSSYDLTSSAVDSNHNALLIGGEYKSNYPSVTSFVGNISNFRWITGTALYTTDTFTVPTSVLTAVSNTQLLIRGNSNDNDLDANNALVGVADKSGVNRIITVIPGVVYSSDAPSLTVPNNPPTGSVTIVSVRGSTTVGTLLTATNTLADADGLGTFSYSWSSSSTSNGSFTPISGATSSTYTSVSEDIGNYIKATISYTDGAGNNESVSSSSFGPISGTSSKGGGTPPPPPPPTQVPISDINSGATTLNETVSAAYNGITYVAIRASPLANTVAFNPASGVNPAVQVANLPAEVASVSIATAPLQVADNTFRFVVKAFDSGVTPITTFTSPLQFTVAFPGFTAATATVLTYTNIDDTSPSDTVTATITPGTSDYTFTLSHLTYFVAQETSSSVPCFPAGVRIATPEGAKAVEMLKTGDYVTTADGRVVPVRVYSRFVANTTVQTAPYMIPANALGRNAPRHPLRLSPLHAFQIRPNVWQIPQEVAKRCDAVTQYDVGKPVTYYHIECPNFYRDNLVADGNVVESFGGNQVRNKAGLYRYNPALGGFTRRSGEAVVMRR